MANDTLDTAVEFAEVLESLGVRYMIGGSVASTIWGEPRFTLDVDFVAELQDQHVAGLVNALEGAWYVDEGSVRDAIQHRKSFNVIRLKLMVKVDVFVPSDEGLHSSKWGRVRLELITPESTLRIPVTSPEDILLQKLDWYRSGECVSESQWRDVGALLRVQETTLDNVYLDEWASRMELTKLLERARSNARE